MCKSLTGLCFLQATSCYSQPFLKCNCHAGCHSTQNLIYCIYLHFSHTVLLQHGADPNIRNTDGKSALDLADPSAKAVLTGQYLSAACLPLLRNL